MSRIDSLGTLTDMATYRDGNVRRATANTVTSMRRSAASRQCPKCHRKSALARFSEDWGFGTSCRWCDFERATVRELDGSLTTTDNLTSVSEKASQP